VSVAVESDDTSLHLGVDESYSLTVNGRVDVFSSILNGHVSPSAIVCLHSHCLSLSLSVYMSVSLCLSVCLSVSLSGPCPLTRLLASLRCFLSCHLPLSYPPPPPTVATDAILRAQTVWGAMYGLQTLMQVFHYDYNKEMYYATSLPLQVTDQPRYPWRGLLLDSARHYLLVDEIKHQIDALAYNKLNVLHWHVIDAQSFPICSKSRPELCGMCFLLLSLWLCCAQKRCLRICMCVCVECVECAVSVFRAYVQNGWRCGTSAVSVHLHCAVSVCCVISVFALVRVSSLYACLVVSLCVCA
jgi:Glycosyl hydrolase family 20, catalytic domain